MSAIINVGSTPAIPPFPAAPARATASAGSTSACSCGDVVEFSPIGRALARAAELSSFSLAKVRAIREEIASGTYETPERIAGTVQRLVDVLA